MSPHSKLLGLPEGRICPSIWPIAWSIGGSRQNQQPPGSERNGGITPPRRAIPTKTLRVFLPVLVLLGCKSTPFKPEPSPPPTLTISGILAPVSGPSELRHHAEASPSAGTQLRRAYIFLETDLPDRAIYTLNRLLFGNEKPTNRTLAIAHYLRGTAYEAKNNTERVAHEREQGLQYESSPELRALLKKLGSPAKPVTPVVVKPKPKPPITAPAILTRSKWRAASPRRMTPLGKARRITVHHSAVTGRQSSQSKSAREILSMQQGHMGGEKKWADIGYHYIVDPSGRVWTGRAIKWQGAHAGNPSLNRGNIGVCLIGKFTKGKGGQHPPKLQLKSLESLLTWLCHHHGISVSSIRTHRELHPTECPGEHLQAAIVKFRRQHTASTRTAGASSRR